MHIKPLPIWDEQFLGAAQSAGYPAVFERIDHKIAIRNRVLKEVYCKIDSF
ncbi:MAG: hypothetical protein V3581_01985 [Candidatus Cardinium sp.]|uniref:hypothetical protein n=1 Tax=Candidatus Cardinium sp. TP TaxID=2961955 RepID=UPI0021AED44B|nr:hypothetical protein [Candidatus Cardinium sp. TP]MCT4697007.1 hypothetical protein [Candidatus Cardinium sp. TP]MDN5246937.1 hypothetical protein [Candidatus Cardinium sp.]